MRLAQFLLSLWCNHFSNLPALTSCIRNLISKINEKVSQCIIFWVLLKHWSVWPLVCRLIGHDICPVKQVHCLSTQKKKRDINCKHAKWSLWCFYIWIFLHLPSLSFPPRIPVPFSSGIYKKVDSIISSQIYKNF